MSQSAIPRPDKFDATMNVEVYFKQFELFLTLTKVLDTDKANYLLSYLDFSVFEAVSSGLNTTTASYDDIKKFLVARYSSVDNFLERISFFAARFSFPVDSFAASLNGFMDRFSSTVEELREQLLVSKFIQAAPSNLASELRVRRPTSLNDCVQISSSLNLCAPVCSANAKEKVDSTRKVHSKQCYRCGSSKHLASDSKCPAISVTCHKCGKKGHFQTVCHSENSAGRPTTGRWRVGSIIARTMSLKNSSRPIINASISNVSVGLIVDTGADVSVLTVDVYRRYFAKVPLQAHSNQLSNCDGSTLFFWVCWKICLLLIRENVLLVNSLLLIYHTLSLVLTYFRLYV